jgi:hypothetical protein
MKKWLKLGVVPAILALIVVLALSASAFANGPASQDTRLASGQGYGPGNRGGSQNSLVAVAARVLGMSQTDLIAQLDNKTIAAVAKEKGVATSKIVDAFLAPRVEALRSAVSAGRLTQAQADQSLATMKANVTARLNNTWTPRGPGLGTGFVDANHDGICDYRNQ